MEERLRAQRREAEATAERSALDVAHLMRAAQSRALRLPPQRRDSLPQRACRRPMPPDNSPEPRSTRAPTVGGTESVLGQASDSGAQDEALARSMERAEALTSERAAEEQAARASPRRRDRR